VTGFSDSDWAANIDDRTSISGGIVRWGYSPILWFSRKQRMICTSTAEAETHAIIETTKGVNHVAEMIREMVTFMGNFSDIKTPIVYSDNQPAIDAILNGKGRTKHYDIKIKFINQQVENKNVILMKVSTEDNTSDIFTKPLRSTKFKRFRHQALGISMIGANMAFERTNENAEAKRDKFSAREFEGKYWDVL
jgi:hypothetical protein